MPTLNWIGREAVINHHNEIPYRLLRCNGELSVGDSGNGNLLVEGDNLELRRPLRLGQALLSGRWGAEK